MAASAFDANTPPGAEKAAWSCALAVAGSTFTMRSARRARSELANFCHAEGLPP